MPRHPPDAISAPFDAGRGIRRPPDFVVKLPDRVVA